MACACTRAARPDAPAQVLAGANGLPSPTWNHLDINDVDLVVPAVSGFDAAAVQNTNGEKGTCCESAETSAAPGFDAAPREGAVGGMGALAGAWLRAAASADGRVRRVEVPAGARAGEPVCVAVAPGAVEALELAVGAGASAQLVLVASAGEGEAAGEPAGAADSAGAPDPAAPLPTCGWTVRVAAGPDARVEVFSVAAVPGAQCLDDLALELGEGARVAVRQYYLEGAVSAAGLSADLAGARSELSVDARYLGRGDDKLDFNYAVAQRGRATKAGMRFGGVLGGNASKTLRDTIDLVRGCKGSAGKESESVVLVGESVSNKSLPVILCGEDDVAGDHGATVGEVDPAQLAYLASRGLELADVHALLMESTFAGAAALAPTEAARAAVEASAARVLGTDFFDDGDGDRGGER